VYSEVDHHALHVRMADEALLLGPANPAESYLSIERIVQVARECHADAVHPGYGFLSENENFAAAIEKAGLVFIGPSPDAIEMMADKGRARQKMQAAGVPVIPGYDGDDADEILIEQAKKIGFPLLVKAAAGGGGKGMQVVTDEASLAEGIAAARREAQYAFGSGRLILERYIPQARHIEFQILADNFGYTLHLFERECSIQRRHQKVIEETPSPFLDADLRGRMGQVAVDAARAVKYRNAGTIEFIVEAQTREFYFLEMNTRLQVEHAITEAVTGLDLVQWQIRVASGERLPWTQAELTSRGHAIECRLYAEDPANNFLPSTGSLLRWVEPQGPGVRVDSGYAQGDVISIQYDPLVAKIIASSEDRPSAIHRMAAALQSTVLLGTTHNGQFLQDVIARPEFAAGEVSTTWVEEQFGDWQPPVCALPPEVLIAAALAGQQAVSRDQDGRPNSGNDPYSPWQAINFFRPGENPVKAK
jgi:acetyl/propionyl-CoA carboxylase alpha subunit